MMRNLHAEERLANGLEEYCKEISGQIKEKLVSLVDQEKRITRLYVLEKFLTELKAEMFCQLIDKKISVE